MTWILVTQAGRQRCIAVSVSKGGVSWPAFLNRFFTRQK
jgi:hypothetical protein